MWDETDAVTGFAAADDTAIHLLVDTGARGKGVGRALLAWARDAVRDAGHAVANLTLAPNGNLLTANGGNGNIVETTPFGNQLAEVNTGAGEGGLFGLTITPNRRGVYFVNDTENKLDLLH